MKRVMKLETHEVEDIVKLANEAMRVTEEVYETPEDEFAEVFECEFTKALEELVLSGER